MIYDMILSIIKNERKAYWQLKAIQTIVTKGREITDHKQAAWLAFDIATMFYAFTSGDSHAGSIVGHCAAGAQNREFGWAAGFPLPGVHGSLSHDVTSPVGSCPMPSHQTFPSEVSATFVNTEFFARVLKQFQYTNFTQH